MASGSVRVFAVVKAVAIVPVILVVPPTSNFKTFVLSELSTIVVVESESFLFVNVLVLVAVTSGVTHSSPVVVAEFAVRTFPFDPTVKTDKVSLADAERRSPLALKLVA